MPRTESTLPGILIQETNSSGLITLGQSAGAPSSLATAASTFAIGCELVDTTTGLHYYNAGTVAVPSWNSTTEVTTAEIATGAITAPKLAAAQSVTSTADGLTTGLIVASSAEMYVAATSASATYALTLPAISASTIGQKVYITVGANGYELLTPATSNNTINLVDSDGTNQLDVAANTTVRCTQVSATGWVCETIAATSIAVTAPDND